MTHMPLAPPVVRRGLRISRPILRRKRLKQKIMDAGQRQDYTFSGGIMIAAYCVYPARESQ
jgi:hypothetical protein